MPSWRYELEEILRTGMRYCFPAISGKYPEIVEDEFAGKDGDAHGIGGESGFLDGVLSLVSDLRKKAFLKGYTAGARDSAHDLNAAFDEDISKIGASRAFEVYEEEERNV